MDPNEVRFTQSSVRSHFADGGSIDDLAEALRTGIIKPEEIPPLRLFVKNGVYYSLDNRRLEAFRRAAMPIPFRLATPEEVVAESRKLTTSNDGVSIKIRGLAQ